MAWSPHAPYLARAHPEDDDRVFKLFRRCAAPMRAGGRGGWLDMDRPGPDQPAGRRAQERRAWPPRARAPASGPGRLAAGFGGQPPLVIVGPAVRMAEQLVGVGQCPEAGRSLGILWLGIGV